MNDFTSFPIHTLAASLLPDLGSVTDSSAFIGLRAGLGQFSATALRDYVGGTGRSVRSYGAVGDGVADDSPAFAAAIAAADADGGGQIIIPKGNYRLNSAVSATAGNIHFIGDGAESWILNGTTDAAALTIGDGTTITYNYRVSGLQFATASGVVSAAGNIGLRARKVGQSRFDNLVFTQFPSAGFDGLSLEEVSQSTVTSIFSQNNKRHGVYMHLCLDIYITNCRSDANITGFNIDDCQGIYCANAAGYANTGNAWWLSFSAVGNVNLFFVNCIGDTSGGSNWNIQSLKRSTFANCWGSSQINAAVDVTAGGFDLVGSDCSDITFAGGMAFFNNGSGVHLITATGSPSYITFNGMLFGATGVGNGQSGTGYGLAIDGGCSHIKVLGGAAHANTTAQIINNATAPGSDIQVFGVAGFVSRNSGQATLDGAGTSVVVSHGLSAQPNPHDILICPTTGLGDAKTLWVDTVTATQFTVHADVAPTSLSPFFNWSALLVVD